MRSLRTDRSGISLTEILIGIMVLGIGVISLATLFPIGLLRMKRAVNNVRGTVAAENAWHEVRARNLLAPPFGPPANYFSRYPTVPGAWPNNGWASAITPNSGPGVPVIIDPLWMIQNVSRPDRHRFGMLDLVNNTSFLPVPDGLPDGAFFGEGLLRVPGFFSPGPDLVPGTANGGPLSDGNDDGMNGVNDPGEFGWPGSDDLPFHLINPVVLVPADADRLQQSLWLASELFSSPDDMTFGEGENKRMLPLQDLIAPTPGVPPYLTPVNGVPFRPNLAGPDGLLGTADDIAPTLLREARYSWIIIARKVNARQGLTYGVGTDGVPGTNTGGPMGDGDDDGNGIINDTSELGWPGSDDVILTLSDYGPNELTGPLGTVPTADDPARERMTGLPVPAPVGPFHITIVVFYNRDLSRSEPVFANTQVLAPAIVPATEPIFVGPEGRDGIRGTADDIPGGSDVATLYARSDGVPFPEIPIGSYIMDTTFDSRPPSVAGATGIRSFVYRVTSKTLDVTGKIMTLSLDQKARGTGRVLTVLKGAVGVFEKQVP